MTEYTLEYQYGMDIAWYFLGADDTVAVFNSGGAIIPDIIAKNAEGNQLLISYFNNLVLSTEAIINPLLDKYFDKDTLLYPFSQYGTYYAQRGLASFDKINPGPGNHTINYHLQARPAQPLNFQLFPSHIKEILLKTRQPINFNDFYKIDEGYAPWAALFTDYYAIPTYEPKPVNKSKWWFFFR